MNADAAKEDVDDVSDEESEADSNDSGPLGLQEASDSEDEPPSLKDDDEDGDAEVNFLETLYEPLRFMMHFDQDGPVKTFKEESKKLNEAVSNCKNRLQLWQRRAAIEARRSLCGRPSWKTAASVTNCQISTMLRCTSSRARTAGILIGRESRMSF